MMQGVLSVLGWLATGAFRSAMNVTVMPLQLIFCWNSGKLENVDLILYDKTATECLVNYFRAKQTGALGLRYSLKMI